jgi:hypothetical protein
MTRAGAATALAWIVGGAFVILGVVEVVTRLWSGEPADLAALAWWAAALCGGGVLVLLGGLVITRPGVSFACLFIGCLAGIVATAWTVVLPLLAVSLLVLRLLESNSSPSGAGQ